MFYKKIWIFTLIGTLWCGIIYLIVFHGSSHTSQTTPHLIIETGEKLYDWVVFDTFQEETLSEAIVAENIDQNDIFETLKKNDFYNCSSTVNREGRHVNSCDNITGTYYNFNVPEWGIRIWYFESSKPYVYEGTWKVLFYEPKLEEWYLSWNTLYWDNVFSISYFDGWDKNEIHYPDSIEYRWTKFFNTGRDNNSGKQYENFPKEWEYKRYARTSLITDKSKNYYYILFQELRDCWPFCGIDQHTFNFFLK